MGRQAGSTPFTGRIGEMSFYYNKKYGYLVRKKGGPDKGQIKRMKSFEEVRQNNSEFGEASSCNKLIRSAFEPLFSLSKDYDSSRRLQALIVDAIRADKNNPQGQRKLRVENLAALSFFAISTNQPANKFFSLPIREKRVKNGLKITFRSQVPTLKKDNATYWQVVGIAARIDFEERSYTVEEKRTDMIRPTTRKKNFELQYKFSGRGSDFYGLCICFYKEIDGKLHILDRVDLKGGFISFLK